MKKLRDVYFQVEYMFIFCMIFLMYTNTVSAQLFWDETIGYEPTIEDSKKTIASLNLDIRAIKNQMMILKNEIKNHNRVIDDFQKAEDKYENLQFYYDDKPNFIPYFKTKVVNKELAADPLYLSGDIVITNWRDLEVYRKIFGPKAQMSREALELLEEDLRLMTNELQDKEELLARLQKGITKMQSKLAIEGLWHFVKPKNDSTMWITYNKDRDIFIGEWCYLDGIKYFKKGDVVLTLEPPTPDNPHIYKGTEFGFDDSGRQIRLPLIIRLEGKMMTYRTKERTYILKGNHFYIRN